VPIIGRIFARKDGMPWEFDVKAIYASSSPAIDQGTLYFQFDYLRESLESGAASGQVGVGVYMVKIAPDVDPTRVMSAIDLMYEKGPQKVQTTTEAEFGRQFISMLGNVPLLLRTIGGAVLFAIFFAVLNTMLMAGRERTRDLGIMKALGFSDSAVFKNLILESLLLCLLGGALAVGLAKVVESGMQRFMSSQFPGFAIGPDTMLLGLVIAVGIGLLAGLAPGLRASKLLPVEALRDEG